jgi:hypothetical protein
MVQGAPTLTWTRPTTSRWRCLSSLIAPERAARMRQAVTRLTGYEIRGVRCRTCSIPQLAGASATVSNPAAGPQKKRYRPMTIALQLSVMACVVEACLCEQSGTIRAGPRLSDPWRTRKWHFRVFKYLRMPSAWQETHQGPWKIGDSGADGLVPRGESLGNMHRSRVWSLPILGPALEVPLDGLRS